MLAILLILCAFCFLGISARNPILVPLPSQGNNSGIVPTPGCIKFTPQSKTGPETRRRPLNSPSRVSTSVNLISPLPNRSLIR